MDPLVRLIVGTLMISGAWFGVRRYARRRATEGRKQLQVLARLGLAKGVSVTVVRIADRGLVLGVSDKGVSLVAELASQDLEDVAAIPAGATPQPAASPAPQAAPQVVRGLLDEPRSSGDPRMGLVQRLQRMTLRTNVPGSPGTPIRHDLT